MTQVMTKGCIEGTCEHAPFPHKIVENELRERRQIPGTRNTEVVKTGVIQHVVCLACKHWARAGDTYNGRACDCRYDCHNSGIKASLTVLD